VQKSTLARPAFAEAATRRQAKRFSVQARLYAETPACATCLHPSKRGLRAGGSRFGEGRLDTSASGDGLCPCGSI